MSITFEDKNSKHTFVMAKDNPTADHILIYGIFEWPLIVWCKQFSDKHKLFLDIGSHMGTYSILLSDYFEEVHSFEPQKSTFEYMCNGIGLNDKTNIIPHNVALGNLENRSTLHKISADGGGSTLLKRDNCSVETVDVRTLDSFNLSNIGFIKIDVEGFELEVLEGSVETLTRSHFPKFIFESWNGNKKLRDKLFTRISEIGYEIIRLQNTTDMFLAIH
uniref:Putative methyltransferase n=1 Tax=Pithovirus LCPAC403 TaxID=2506596 RepID=A0A481ZBD5_9VIRU|nr:MAG: putative methyltransferase [Pithovirus LCPAC403]